ncbi:LLM class flavin-dependent oxidoreductase [Fodinicola acaciae]|uniref:LLM class flavin-dependent oxidoreductase n=1 Tax=Fodinicola acaciae TaxID=2681555 RepID=UPI0013D4573C|nr:LLM class flavin-dependent oxidoreductase [Fodinicola acaciae]
MRLGVNVTHLDPGVAVDAERLGFQLALVPEGFRADAVSVLGWLSGRTQRIALSAICQLPVRTPVATAMTAATLHTLSGGRFQLGLGISNSHTAEVWHGVPFHRPLARTREYVDIVRMALAGEEIRYAGELFQIPLPGRTGAGFRMPGGAAMPINLAAVGPRNLELTGLIADGWIGVFSSPERIEEILPLIWNGRDASGRPRETFGIVLSAGLSVDDDPEKAAEALKPHAARFMCIGHREKNFYYRLAVGMGLGAEATRVQDLYASGDVTAATAAVPFDFVDATGLVGPIDRIAAKMKAYATAGVTTLALTPYGSDRVRALEIAAAAHDQSGVV